MLSKLDFKNQKNFSHNSNHKSGFVPKSKWWTPVWSGLLIEPTAKHYKAMKNAVWLYLYLLMYANRRTGSLFRRNSTIARDMNLNSRTVSRWMKILKENNYVKVRPTGRSLQISITKWKPINKNKKL